MDILKETGILKASRAEQEDFLNQLPEVMIKLKEVIQRPPFLIGKIYRRIATSNVGVECEYCFLDWNGELRFLNITRSSFWKGTLKSRNFRKTLEHKVTSIPYCVAVELLGGTAIADSFVLKEN